VADPRLDIGVFSQPPLVTAARAVPCVARGSGGEHIAVETAHTHLHDGSRGRVVLRRYLQRRAAYPRRAPSSLVMHFFNGTKMR